MKSERRLSQRGVFLVQALVLAVVLAFVVTLTLRLSLGRSVTVNRTNESETKRFLAQSVEGQVYACLVNTVLDPSTCNVPPAVRSCFPTSMPRGEPVVVQFSLSGGAGPCRMEITIGDRPGS